jgi:hypothetical protein
MLSEGRFRFLFIFTRNPFSFFGGFAVSEVELEVSVLARYPHECHRSETITNWDKHWMPEMKMFEI